MSLTASQYSKAEADFDGNLSGNIEAWVYTETVEDTTTTRKIKYVFGFKQTSVYNDTQRFRAWIDGDLEYDDTFTNNKGSGEWQFYAVNKTYNRPAYGSSSVNHTARSMIGDSSGAGTIFDGSASDTGHQNTDTDVPAKAGTVLGAPGNVVWAETQSSALRWSWTAPSGAGIGPAAYTYWVQVALDPGFTQLVANGEIGNVLTYWATGLTRATTYYLRVRAGNAHGWGAFSGPVGATTSALPPGTMAAPTVNTPTTSGFNVAFAAPADNGGSPITSYEIQLSSDNFSTVHSTVTGVTSSPRVITGLNPGVKYKARVRAINAVGGASWSASSVEIQTLGGVKVWNGSAWIEGIVRQWNGSSWNVVVVRKWNGSSWIV